MTTIAYRDGIMASDTGSSAGNACHQWATKIMKTTDGTLYGCAGNAAECSQFIQKVKANHKDPLIRPRPLGDFDSSFIVLIAKPDGGLWLLTAHGMEDLSGADYFAIGIDAPCAFGAFFAGASAESAILAAIAHGSGTFGSVDVVRRERNAA